MTGLTEAEWLACADPEPMLKALRGRASDRKLRLFACACVWEYVRIMSKSAGFDSEWMTGALLLSERYADGEATYEEWWRETRSDRHFPPWKQEDAYTEALDAVEYAGVVAGWEGAARFDKRQEAAERRRLSALLRCVAGDSTRPVTFDPGLRTHTVASLARAAYDEREVPSCELDPARLAVLSDALEEAGCTDPELLAHLRSPGPHVRGCWALDLILGKS